MGPPPSLTLEVPLAEAGCDDDGEGISSRHHGAMRFRAFTLSLSLYSWFLDWGNRIGSLCTHDSFSFTLYLISMQLGQLDRNIRKCNELKIYFRFRAFILLLSIYSWFLDWGNLCTHDSFSFTLYIISKWASQINRNIKNYNELKIYFRFKAFTLSLIFYKSFLHCGNLIGSFRNHTSFSFTIYLNKLVITRTSRKCSVKFSCKTKATMQTCSNEYLS